MVTQISIVLFKTIGDHKRKNGKYEYGCCVVFLQSGC